MENVGENELIFISSIFLSMSRSLRYYKEKVKEDETSFLLLFQLKQRSRSETCVALSLGSLERNYYLLRMIELSAGMEIYGQR